MKRYEHWDPYKTLMSKNPRDQSLRNQSLRDYSLEDRRNLVSRDLMSRDLMNGSLLDRSLMNRSLMNRSLMNHDRDLAAQLSGRRMMSRLRLVERLPRGLSVSTTWLGALGLSCLSLACARTVDERVVAISRLLEEARAFQAEQYVPETFARAEDLLSRARLEITAQQERPWYLSSQRHARELLRESEAAASLLRAEAAAALVRVRQEATRELAGAHTALDRASEAYWRSPRGQDTRADQLRMRSDLDGLLRDLNKAEVALEQGELLAASRLASKVERRASEVAWTIERATAFRIGEAMRKAETLVPGELDPDAALLRAPAPSQGKGSWQTSAADPLRAHRAG